MRREKRFVRVINFLKIIKGAIPWITPSTVVLGFLILPQWRSSVFPTGIKFLQQTRVFLNHFVNEHTPFLTLEFYIQFLFCSKKSPLVNIL